MCPQYVQYGCGETAPRSWRNFDCSPTLLLQRIPWIGRLFTAHITFPPHVLYGNIVKGLPVPDGTCDLVYCSHVLEHLSFEDLSLALKKTYRLLKPGGVFRFVMPDLALMVRRYESAGGPGAAPEFMRATGLGIEQRNRHVNGMARDWLGNSRHLWLWDYAAIRAELGAAGFLNVRRARQGDSRHSAFNAVETPDRWKDSLGVECEK